MRKFIPLLFIPFVFSCSDDEDVPNMMSKAMLLIIGYLMVFISVISYYKTKNLRNPFTKWGGWKSEVKTNEKIILAFILQIPLFIYLFTL